MLKGGKGTHVALVSVFHIGLPREEYAINITRGRETCGKNGLHSHSAVHGKTY